MDTGTFDLAIAEPADRVELERCPSARSEARRTGCSASSDRLDGSAKHGRLPHYGVT
jgi:hypothetical protein